MFRSVRIAFRLLVSGRSAELKYVVRNRLKGLDLEFVSAEGLGLSPETSHYHSNSGGPSCARVFRSLRIPPGSVALDLGSGKGGAVITLRELPFEEIVGVEISPELVSIATDNVTRLRLRNIRFIQSDAAAFTDLDRFTHIYMYNPFPCGVVARVMDNVAASLASADREITLVYRNPLCDAEVRSSGLFERMRSMTVEEHECVIYRYVPRSSVGGSDDTRRSHPDSSTPARSPRATRGSKTDRSAPTAALTSTPGRRPG